MLYVLYLKTQRTVSRHFYIYFKGLPLVLWLQHVTESTDLS